VSEDHFGYLVYIYFVR